MRHDDYWYDKLAQELGHPGFATLAEVRQAEAREARETAATARWTYNRDCGDYTLAHEGGRYLIMRDGRTWRVSAWPSGNEAESAVRRLAGIRTLAEAKGLALAYPCYRCGLAAPLVLMTPAWTARTTLSGDAPSYRCLDTETCEAEHARLTGTAPARIEI